MESRMSGGVFKGTRTPVLVLMSVTKVSLLDVASKAAKKGGTVFSVTPEVRGRKPVFVVLVANKGKVQELTYDLMTGAEAKPSKAQVGAR
jgi:hypothetical protein